MKLTDVYDRALAKYGHEAQIVMAQEECSELITGLCRWYRDRSDADDVAEEIADVQIMMKQLARIVGEEQVASERKRKLDRLRERLDE